MWKWDYSEKGPISEVDQILLDEKGNQIISIENTDEGIYLNISEENKRLISAAPDMYEALGKALKELEDWHDVPCNGCSTCIDIIPMIKAALRKAEGRP
jgi:hypothetical protein